MAPPRETDGWHFVLGGPTDVRVALRLGIVEALVGVRPRATEWHGAAARLQRTWRRHVAAARLMMALRTWRARSMERSARLVLQQCHLAFARLQRRVRARRAARANAAVTTTRALVVAA